MKKKSENSIKKDPHPKKRSRENKAVTIEDSKEQKSSTYETLVPIEDDSYTETEPIQENTILDRGHSITNFGIKYERPGIESSSFEGIYFKSFKWAFVANIVLPLAGWYIVTSARTFPIYRALFGAAAFPVLGILWAIGLIVVGNIRKDGYRAILGWGWIAGLLSAIVTLILGWGWPMGLFSSIGILAALIFGFENLVYSPITGLLTLLVGIIFVGLLVNVPAEVSIELNKRRARKIKEHISIWGEETCQTIINREVQPDMTKEMVLLSWGEPTAIEDQEATRNYFTEKWVYTSPKKSIYVWFTNGIVDKIKNNGT